MAPRRTARRAPAAPSGGASAAVLLAAVAGALLLSGVGADAGFEASGPAKGPSLFLGQAAAHSEAARAEGSPEIPAPGAATVELDVVRVSHTSAADEVSKTFQEALVGAFMIFVSFPVLWFNERRQAKMWALFGRAKKIVKQNVSSESVDPSNEACLVHTKGVTANASQLSDAQFGVAVSNCAALMREAEMFQWVEHERKEERDDNFGGKETVTTYSYTQEWCASPKDSSGFQEGGHDNPPMPCEGQTFRAEAVSFGTFGLSKGLIGQMCKFKMLAPSELPPQIALPGGNFLGGKAATLQGSTYTTVQQGMSPQIGDMRIGFKKVPCGDATVLAVQHNGTFAPLRADMQVKGRKVVRPQGGDASLLDYSNTCEMLDQAETQDDNLDLDSASGCCACCALVGKLVERKEEVYMIAEAHESAAAMFKSAQDTQACIHTVLQIVGFLLLWFGLSAILSLLPAVFRFIPFVGVFIQHVGNFLAGAVSFLLASVLWCITVAVAWLAARPMKAGLLLGIAAFLVLVPWYLSNQPHQPHYG